LAPLRTATTKARQGAASAVVVELETAGARGFGHTYADASAAAIVEGRLRDCLTGRDAMDVPAAWQAMCESVRNIGLAGVAAGAISAVDVALWDLKAHLGERLQHCVARRRETKQCPSPSFAILSTTTPPFNRGGHTTFGWPCASRIRRARANNVRTHGVPACARAGQAFARQTNEIP
jgi:hypothetical protein